MGSTHTVETQAPGARAAAAARVVISLTAPRFPRDARVPDLHAECARGTIAMHRAHGIPLSLGGSALEPDEHAPLDQPRACSSAVTVAPGAGR